MTSMLNRSLSPYEKNHLIRFGINSDKIDQYGEMPVEYITGKTIFLGREFTVTPAVLIPRVETEELVELIQQDLLKNPPPSSKAFQIADVGTGSGAIGVSLAAFFEQHHWLFEIILTDISQKALEIARKNFKALFPQALKQVSFLKSDLLADFSQDQSLDLIVANLPYIPAGRISTLDASVKDFEPLTALDGGADGLKYIFELLGQAKTFLQPGGKIYLELDDTHAAEQFQPFTDVYQFEFHPDQFGKQRFAVGTLKSSL